MGDVSFDEIGVNFYDGAGALPFFVCPLRGVGVSKYADLDGNVFAVLFFYLVEGHVGRGNLVELIFCQFNFRGRGRQIVPGLSLGIFPYVLSGCLAETDYAGGIAALSVDDDVEGYSDEASGFYARFVMAVVVFVSCVVPLEVVYSLEVSFVLGDV